MKIPNVINVLAFAPNPTAGLLTAKEVERIGRKPEIFWNIQSVWDRVCINSVKNKSKYMSEMAPFSCLRGHYHLMKKSLDMKQPSVWVVEDDTRFLKNVDAVNERLGKAPEDADVLLLDYNVGGDLGGENFTTCRRKMAEAVDGWWEIDDEDLRGTGNYLMSWDAMIRYADVLSLGATAGEMFAADIGRNHKWFPGCRIYAATPNLSIQQIDCHHKHMCSNDTLRDYWRRCGVNTEEYQEW